MGRRDDDARPPIEVLGADLGTSSTQTVAVGPRRPKPGRGRSVAIALAVVAVVGGGLALGDGGGDPEGAADSEEAPDGGDGEERSTTTTRRRTTTTRPSTTTSTTGPLGPILGEPVEGALLLFTRSAWQRIDLTTGEITRMELPGGDMYTGVALAGGVALPSPAGGVYFYPVLGAPEDPEGVLLGPGEQVARAGPDRLWLFDAPEESDPDPTPHVSVRLVDVTGRVLRSFQAPGRYLTEGTADVVLTSRGGRVYAVDEAGVRPLATGWLHGTMGDAALVMGCDDEAACSLRRLPTDGGEGRTVLDARDPDSSYLESFEAPDGRTAVVEYHQSSGAVRLLLFEADGDLIVDLTPDQGGWGGQPQFLPGDLGLLGISNSSVAWIHAVDGSWLVDDLRTEDALNGEAMFVVTP